MNFIVYGPFELPRGDNGLIAADRRSKRQFWDNANETEEGLPEACGCYVFALSAGGVIRPWYVGKAEGNNFKKECFGLHKLVHYNNVLAARNGRPLIYLIAKTTINDNFVRPSTNGHVDITNLERILIGMALSRNRELCNLTGTTYLRNISVRSLINSRPGNPGRAAASLRDILRPL